MDSQAEAAALLLTLPGVQRVEPNGVYVTVNGVSSQVVVILVGAVTAQEYGWRTLPLWLSRGIPRPAFLCAKFLSLVIPVVLIVFTALLSAGAITALLSLGSEAGFQTGGVNFWQLLLSIQVVVLTSFHDDTHIYPAIRAGALSYLLKDVGPKELAEAVRSAARGEAVIHPRVAARLVKELRGDREQVQNPFMELSERELEVLPWIAKGLSNTEIAGQ